MSSSVSSQAGKRCPGDSGRDTHPGITTPGSVPIWTSNLSSPWWTKSRGSIITMSDITSVSPIKLSSLMTMEDSFNPGRIRNLEISEQYWETQTCRLKELSRSPERIYQQSLRTWIEMLSIPETFWWTWAKQIPSPPSKGTPASTGSKKSCLLHWDCFRPLGFLGYPKYVTEMPSLVCGLMSHWSLIWLNKQQMLQSKPKASHWGWRNILLLQSINLKWTLTRSPWDQVVSKRSP